MILMLINQIFLVNPPYFISLFYIFLVVKTQNAQGKWWFYKKELLRMKNQFQYHARFTSVGSVSFCCTCVLKNSTILTSYLWNSLECLSKLHDIHAKKKNMRNETSTSFESLNLNYFTRNRFPIQIVLFKWLANSKIYYIYFSN